MFKNAHNACSNAHNACLNAHNACLNAHNACLGTRGPARVRQVLPAHLIRRVAILNDGPWMANL